MTLRWGVVLALLVHGAIVAAQAAGVPNSWVFGNQQVAGVVLALVAGGILILAGAALAMAASPWRVLAVVGAGVSLLFFVVYFQPLILIGLGIDIAILVLVGRLSWPTKEMVGA